eukprot:CAMPEP_0203726346 /NCGR_PEP_ID=MMETSP0092-20131115/9210_1 /ASSEMBLY_ACC=CAM_ASM_001090 /TAXON_ID=426623 /ORGANISM="Chaetoceros affinis, Strain CCMP159" /LENGTH=64 /DNA_ID=CAMNT_0050607565 /DNA_START=48 /DNA_END=239 /DNA_ORIENTATION=-
MNLTPSTDAPFRHATWSDEAPNMSVDLASDGSRLTMSCITSVGAAFPRANARQLSPDLSLSWQN